MHSFIQPRITLISFSSFILIPTGNVAKCYLNNIPFLCDNPFNEDIFISVSNFLEGWGALEDDDIVSTRLPEIVCDLKDSSKRDIKRL